MYLTIFNIRSNLQKVNESMFNLKKAIDLMPIREYNEELNTTWKMMRDMKTSLSLRLDAIEKKQNMTIQTRPQQFHGYKMLKHLNVRKHCMIVTHI